MGIGMEEVRKAVYRQDVCDLLHKGPFRSTYLRALKLLNLDGRKAGDVERRARGTHVTDFLCVRECDELCDNSLIRIRLLGMRVRNTRLAVLLMFHLSPDAALCQRAG